MTPPEAPPVLYRPGESPEAEPVPEPDRFQAEPEPERPPPAPIPRQYLVDTPSLLRASLLRPCDPEAHTWRGDEHLRVCTTCGSTRVPTLDRQPTRDTLPPPLPPEAIKDRQKTMLAPMSYTIDVGLEGDIAAECGELRRKVEALESEGRVLRMEGESLRQRVGCLRRSLWALRAYLVELEPALPRHRALLTKSLEACGVALMVGEW